MPHITLGLDLGPNSIGWALIDEDEKQIVDLGVRIFPEGVENFDTSKEQSKNENRRLARSMRRQTARRSRRKRNFRNALVQAGLLPDDPKQQAELNQRDPYELRCKALDEKLTPHEIGRVLMHLNQRRGFLSNRKTDRDKKDDTKGLLGEISELAAAMKAAEHRTLGEHLAKLRLDPHERIRNRHTRRDMYQQEFDAIWDTQQKHHPKLLTETLKYGSNGRQKFPKKPEPISNDTSLLSMFGLYGLLFFQRNLKPIPKDIVGLCELEAKQRRCPRADRLAQRFRLYQEVNNLKFIDPESGQERRLSEQERTLLLDKLRTHEKMTFINIRKALGFLESVHFNLEKGHRKTLLGMVTDHRLAHKDIFGQGWHERPESEKNAVVRALLEMDEQQILGLAVNEWGLNEQAAEKLLDVDLPPGYVHLSRKALEKLVPHMDRGLLYMTDDETPSALSEAGYLRPDQIQERIHDNLPQPPDLANPIVRQALFEVRKVVNAIIRKYGKPNQIHIELTRDTKNNAERRQEISKKMRDREAERDNAAAIIRENGIKVTREAINRYLLWKEQDEFCIYSSRPISIAQLFGGEIDFDHILPYSRTLDDSMVNKIVCFRKANVEKGNRTPYEWLAESDPDRFEKIRQRVSKLPYNKRRRFTQKTVELDDFIARQLVDTAYISKAVAEYVRYLFESPHNVLCTKGQLTATLRREWGLNTILQHDNLDLKNRDDHRHHAVDALIVALTNRKRLQDLSRHWGTKPLNPPWEKFRQDADAAINTINVSHRVRRKIFGALHEETMYGSTSKEGEYVVRKPVESLTLPMIDDIRDDERVKKIIIDRLAEFGIELGSGKAIPAEVWKDPLMMSRKPGRQTHNPSVIKKVRIIKRDRTIQPIRKNSTFVKPGSTHHLAIFEWQANGKTKRDAVFVTQLEAINCLKRQQRALSELIQQWEADGLTYQETNRRMRKAMSEIARRDPIIQRDASQLAGDGNYRIPAHAKFKMSLSKDELLLLEIDKQDKLYVFDTAASTTHQMTFYSHTAAKHEGKQYGKLTKYPGSLFALNPRKVTVDPLGRIRFAERFDFEKFEESEIDSEVKRIASEFVNGELSNKQARKQLKISGKQNLGAQFTAETHRLRNQ